MLAIIRTQIITVFLCLFNTVQADSYMGAYIGGGIGGLVSGLNNNDRSITSSSALDYLCSRFNCHL